jgi:hypothetical protein
MNYIGETLRINEQIVVEADSITEARTLIRVESIRRNVKVYRVRKKTTETRIEKLSNYLYQTFGKVPEMDTLLTIQNMFYE